MDISQIGAQAQTSLGQSKATGGKEMGQKQFLKLLVAQMQNQDPINPMDSKQFASQLAQFNSVEQLIGVNNGLSNLQNSQEMMRVEMTNSMAASLTGKDVRALSNQVSLKGGSADVNYELNSSASEVEIIVKDEYGSEVRRETVSNVGSGENSWTWDGKSNDGLSVPEGNYEVEIKATNGDESVKAKMFTEGIAESVRFTGNGVLISIDGIEVPIGNIESVSTNNNQSK